MLNFSLRQIHVRRREHDEKPNAENNFGNELVLVISVRHRSRDPKEHHRGENKGNDDADCGADEAEDCLDAGHLDADDQSYDDNS